MGARTNRTELLSGRRFDNAASNPGEVMLEHDKRIIAHVTGLMHGRLGLRVERCRAVEAVQYAFPPGLLTGRLWQTRPVRPTVASFVQLTLDGTACRVLNRFGDSDGKKTLPDGRGSAWPPAGPDGTE